VKNAMTTFLIYTIVGLLMLNALMYFQQSRMIFFPMSRLHETPADWGLEYEDASFKTEDGVQLHGWYIPQHDSKQVLLFFHGNAGNISHRRASIEIFHRLGVNVLIIDYRGYGKSEGTQSENGLYKDGAAAWSFLTEKKGFAPGDIIIFGRSLGGVVAAHLAAKVQARGVILESTLSSARDFAQRVFWLLSKLVVMRYNWNAAEYVSRINYPVLVLHSPDDDIMPFSLGEKVFEAANEPKQFYRMRGRSGYSLYEWIPDQVRDDEKAGSPPSRG
jgi:fermentation-respiration switch protein FrsA (DUF1100 family)